MTETRNCPKCSAKMDFYEKGIYFPEPEAGWRCRVCKHYQRVMLRDHIFTVIKVKW